MLRCMLRAKIHKATVTDSNINYEGSMTIDQELLDATGIRPYEQIRVGNLNNGERFETYVIPGKRNSGEICLNGATARKGTIGDIVIIFAYGYYPEDELDDYAPRIVVLYGENRIVTPDAG